METPDLRLLHEATWPASQIGTALVSLVQALGFTPAAINNITKNIGEPTVNSDDALQSWLSVAGERLGVEVVAVSQPFGEVTEMLRRLGPSLLRIPSEGAATYLVVMGGGRFGLKVLTPSGEVRRLRIELVQAGMTQRIFEQGQTSARKLIDALGITEQIGAGGLHAFTLERLRDQSISGIWIIRPAPGNAFQTRARAAYLPWLMALLIASRALSTVLFLFLWRLIGRDVFGSDGSHPSVGLWSLCALSLVPIRLLDAWTQSRIALETGEIFKESLLHGILHLQRSAIRGRGVGQLLGTAMEGEISSTAMESALLVLGSLVEIIAAIFVLFQGAGGQLLAYLLIGWLVFTAWAIYRYAQKARHWSESYRTITHDLIERMVGYKTRLIQERVEDRFREEDGLLREYFGRSQEVDAGKLVIGSVIGYGWLALGVVALEPSFLPGRALAVSIAISIGGILLVGNSLRQVVSGSRHLVDVWVAWQQTQPILEASRSAFERSRANPGATAAPTVNDNAPLLQGESLSFRYTEGGESVLRDCNLRIQDGDQVLLEGPSGGGKSTLALMLAGLRVPDSGTICLLGNHFNELSATQWRAQVVLVPQFHDNHVLTDSILFNLVLGRRWPPTANDSQAAIAVCDALGLSGLLEKMPMGLAQPVGDGGWVLSHGERSRLFLARALLQPGARLIILDESFAALDPETLRLAMEGVRATAPALLVIAHP